MVLKFYFIANYDCKKHFGLGHSNKNLSCTNKLITDKVEQAFTLFSHRNLRIPWVEMVYIIENLTNILIAKELKHSFVWLK